MSLGANPARSMAALAAVVVRSMAEISLSDPMNTPKGVRAPPRRTMSRSSRVIGMPVPVPAPWGRLSLASALALLGVLAEALACLHAIAPGLHHAAQQRRWRVGWVGILTIDRLGGVEGGIQANVV